MNLNEKLRKELGGQTGGHAKIWAPPLRIATEGDLRSKPSIDDLRSIWQ